MASGEVIYGGGDVHFLTSAWLLETLATITSVLMVDPCVWANSEWRDDDNGDDGDRTSLDHSVSVFLGCFILQNLIKQKHRLMEQTADSSPFLTF